MKLAAVVRDEIELSRRMVHNRQNRAAISDGHCEAWALGAVGLSVWKTSGRGRVHRTFSIYGLSAESTFNCIPYAVGRIVLAISGVIIVLLMK